MRIVLCSPLDKGSIFEFFVLHITFESNNLLQIRCVTLILMPLRLGGRFESCDVLPEIFCLRQLNNILLLAVFFQNGQTAPSVACVRHNLGVTPKRCVFFMITSTAFNSLVDTERDINSLMILPQLPEVKRTSTMLLSLTVRRFRPLESGYGPRHHSEVTAKNTALPSPNKCQTGYIN